MPVREICLTCKLPLRWIQNELCEGQGLFVHSDLGAVLRAGFTAHAPVPALDHDDAGTPAFFSNPIPEGGDR